MVSIVIPLYNSFHYIEKTIKSCQNQTYKDIEIIVVDDCSTDNSSLIVHSLLRKDPRIIYYCNEKNQGVIRTINFGLKKCRGDYVIVLGNDDILENRHIETYLKYIKKNSYSFLYCSSNLIDGEDQIFGERIAKNIDGNYSLLARRNPINACGVMINYEILKKVGFYPEKLGFRNCGEWYLWIELLHYEKCIYINDIRSNYRIHSANLTKKLYTKENIKSTKDYSCLCMKEALKLKGIKKSHKLLYTVYRWLYNAKMSIKIFFVK